MVFIHGGGFIDGSGSRYGANYFLDNEVVLITIQYRLSALGFLNSEDGVFPGNVGFKDQVMSLKWVKDNIAEYGGDPTRVTIFGQSAGGISVGLHIVSPLSRVLFHRAITQCYASICNAHGLFSENPLELLRDVAEPLNCPSNGSTTEIMECLVGKPASEIATAVPPSLIPHYVPSVDTHSPSVFLPDTPYKLLKEKKANPVPYIIGVVTAEWVKQAIGILHDPDYVDKLNNNWSEYAQDLLVVKDVGKEALESVKTFYFGEKLIGNQTFVNLTNLVCDRTHNHCSYLSATMYGDVANTYLYYLSKIPAKSSAEKADPNFNPSSYGVLAHEDELQFQFPYSGYPEIPIGDQKYYKFSDYFVRLWTNFAATGEPSGMDGLEWKSTSSATKTFWFELNDEPGQTHELDERMKFWDQFSKSQLKLE